MDKATHNVMISINNNLAELGRILQRISDIYEESEEAKTIEEEDTDGNNG